jgi:hypothetical protein
MFDWYTVAIFLLGFLLGTFREQLFRWASGTAFKKKIKEIATDGS